MDDFLFCMAAFACAIGAIYYYGRYMFQLGVKSEWDNQNKEK